MRIEIKNMVCRHCVQAVAQLMGRLGLDVTAVGLGYAEISQDELPAAQWDALDQALRELDFERIVDPDKRLVETIKQVILRHVNSSEPCPESISHCIGEATRCDPRRAARIFSAVEGRTLERYYISAKIEKVKELLSYGELTLSEIAYRLGYSSLPFLSRQFKQETGMTPSQFVASKAARRPLNEI